MRRCGSLALALTLAGCGSWSPVEPAYPQEYAFLAEVDRAAAVLGVSVRGVITDEGYETTCSDGTRCPAAGWYKDGVAYAWRPALLQKDVDYAVALADHETCHALYREEKWANQCAEGLKS